VLSDLQGRWSDVFPGGTRAGLLAPRLGAPALVERGRPFLIELAERGERATVRAALVRHDLPAGQAARCLGGAGGQDGCVPLELVERGRLAAGRDLAWRSLGATPRGLPANERSWDLVLAADGGPPQRAPRAVWIFEGDPARPRPLRVVQLSDLHLGKGLRKAEVERQLVRAIGEVNGLGPDLVLVTGDLVEQGRDPALAERAAGLLGQLEVPAVVIIGNHDYGHFPGARSAGGVDDGYFHFARAFHPHRTLRFTLGGWTFYGFDSGPSLFTPRVLTRGLDEEALAGIGDVLDETGRTGLRGAVLFSHAPTHTVLSSSGNGASALDRCCGHMVHGASALEERLRAAATRGLRVLHLSGHTHWCDVFEWREAGGGHFERWPYRELDGGREVRGRLALVNAPSATFRGLRTVRHAGRPGFVLLDLDERSAKITYRFLAP